MRRLVACVLVVAVAFLQGCAFILRGDTQVVEVRGDRLEVDGKPAKPGMFELARRSDHVVYGTVRGQRDARVLHSELSVGWFVVDLVALGVMCAPVGSVMLLVDLVTGSLWELDPAEM